MEDIEKQRKGDHKYYDNEVAAVRHVESGALQIARKIGYSQVPWHNLTKLMLAI